MKTCSKHFATLMLLGQSACYLAPPPTIDPSVRIEPDLKRVNPIDIAVLPVQNATGSEVLDPLLDTMRREIETMLVYRKYSPRADVDVHMRFDRNSESRSVVDAAFLDSMATKAQEDAILAVSILRWDQTALVSTNRVGFELLFVLYGSRDRKKLWHGSVRGEVVAGGTEAPPRDPDLRAKAAVRELARELISLLPVRKT